MSNRRADDIGMALVRALRSEADVERNARVDRAIDNQGNPIMDNVVLVAGGPGGTIIVTFGAIQGDPEDNAALAAVLDSKVSEADVSDFLNAAATWSTDTDDHPELGVSLTFDMINVLGVDQPSLKVRTAWLHSLLDKLLIDGTNISKSYDAETGTITLSATGGVDTIDWGDIEGDLSDQEDLQDALDGKVDATLGNLLAISMVEPHVSNTDNPHEVTAEQVGAAPEEHEHEIADIDSLQSTLNNKSDVGHGHPAAAIQSGTMNTARLGSGTASDTTYLRGDSTWAAVPSGGSVDWDDVTDKPSTFPPESHEHAASDITSGTLNVARIPDLAISKITNLQSTLNNKSDVGHGHPAAAIQSGTMAIARLPTGTTGSTVALGNHTHIELPVVRRLTSTVLTSATTATSISDLSIAMGVNQVWAITWELSDVLMTGDDGAKFVVTVPSGATLRMDVTGNGAPGEMELTSRLTSSGSLSANAYVRGNFALGSVRIIGTVATGGSSGNATPGIAVASSGDSVSLAAQHSFVVAHRIS